MDLNGLLSGRDIESVGGMQPPFVHGWYITITITITMTIYKTLYDYFKTY
jgi:hypothetical protein